MARQSVASPVEAVLFDLDGTLVDTAALNSTAILETLSDVGCHVTEAQLRLHRRSGGPLLSWFMSELNLAPGVSESAYWRYVETIKTRAALMQAMTGADSLLSGLSARNLPMAVVTNRITEIALPIIDAAGWSRYFGVIVGQETTARPKPAPDPALYALEVLGVTPGRAAVVGDTEADIECGAAAGVKVLIGLVGECPASALRSAGATHVFADLAEVEDLLRWLAG